MENVMRNLILYRVVFCLVVLLLFPAATLRADSVAYMGTVNGDFGTIDLNTGAFSVLGNSGVTLAGMAVANMTLFGSSYHTSTGTLYSVNPANGSLTVIGTSTLDIDDFGSTTSGLYAVGVDANLYRINPINGAATLIGPTGLGFGEWRSLSTNAGTLYFADGANLYTLNTSTGAATLVGSMGGPEEGAMVMEDGTLFGGENLPGFNVNTLNVTTGLATIVAGVSGTSSPFFALAPNPIPGPPPTVPEPGTLLLMGTGLLGLAGSVRRIIRH
jgi:PEP-CTERM motif